jgi:hypothetical protein
MRYFRIRVEGDAHRAAGLLAKSGIQNLVDDEGVTARLVAEDGQRAVPRVQEALEGEPFTVEAQAEARIT